MEVEDLLRKRTTCQINTLEDSNYAVSPRVTLKLMQDFASGIPFTYLLGFSEFYGRKFYINENVLSPRNETELFVDLIVNSGKKYQRILDVGTGSGVILLCLLAEGVAGNGVGCDLSLKALQVAQINAGRLRLQDRCEFLISDRLEKVQGKFDLIISNPPYIKRSSHYSLVHQQVHEHEPHLALYIPDEQYESWFQTFFEQVLNSLSPGGTFMMEGHELELKNQKKQLEAIGFKNIQLLQDYAGVDRFLTALASLV